MKLQLRENMTLLISFGSPHLKGIWVILQNYPPVVLCAIWKVGSPVLQYVC